MRPPNLRQQGVARRVCVRRFAGPANMGHFLAVRKEKLQETGWLRSSPVNLSGEDASLVLEHNCEASPRQGAFRREAIGYGRAPA